MFCFFFNKELSQAVHRRWLNSEDASLWKKVKSPAQGKICYNSQVLAWFFPSMRGNTSSREKAWSSPIRNSNKNIQKMPVPKLFCSPHVLKWLTHLSWEFAKVWGETETTDVTHEKENRVFILIGCFQVQENCGIKGNEKGIPFCYGSGRSKHLHSFFSAWYITLVFWVCVHQKTS